MFPRRNRVILISPLRGERIARFARCGLEELYPTVLNRDEKLPSMRLAAFQYAIAVVLAILVFGLWHLQVVGGQNYHAMAEANRIRKVPMLAPRGRFSTAKAADCRQLSVGLCFLLREGRATISTRTCR